MRTVRALAAHEMLDSKSLPSDTTLVMLDIASATASRTLTSSDEPRPRRRPDVRPTLTRISWRTSSTSA